MANFALRDISNGRTLRGRGAQTPSATRTVASTYAAHPRRGLQRPAANPAGRELLQSYDIMFWLFFSLIVQVSNIRAFLLRIVRREEKAKKNFKGTRMRKLIYPEKTSFHFYYEIIYVYVLLIYVCIHVPTYIQVGITELL